MSTQNPLQNPSVADPTSDVVTIARFTEPMEAEMARLRLQSAGVEAFLSGENAAILEPGLGPLQLQVRASEERDAREILNEPGDENAAETAAECAEYSAAREVKADGLF